jgi:hypothetical protein
MDGMITDGKSQPWDPAFVDYKAQRRSTAGNMLPLWIAVEFTDIF